MSVKDQDNQTNLPPQSEPPHLSENSPAEHNPIQTAAIAAGGSAAGAAVGHLVGGKAGAIVGAVSGAVVGSTMGSLAGDDIRALENKALEALGIAPYEDSVLDHYSWDELRSLSKASH